MAKRRKATVRKRRTATTAVRRRPTRRRKKSDKLVNFFVPLFLIVCILSSLGLVLFFGFRSVAASSFFEVEEIEISGLKKVERETVERIVKAGIAGKGVWVADLEEIKHKIGQIGYVRDVSVSRVLPQKIRVIVDERVPVGLVRVDGKTFRIDRDAKLLDTVPSKTRDDSNFLMIGWNPDVSDKAEASNKARLDLYLKLKEEWKRFELAQRVAAVNLKSLRDVEAIISDSGETVRLSLGNKEFGSRLKTGIKHAAGNGKRISRIDLNRPSPIVIYRD